MFIIDLGSRIINNAWRHIGKVGMKSLDGIFVIDLCIFWLTCVWGVVGVLVCEMFEWNLDLGPSRQASGRKPWLTVYHAHSGLCITGATSWPKMGGNYM